MFPVVWVNKGSHSHQFIATTKGELVSSDETQEGKNTYHLGAFGPPMVSPEETQDVKTQNVLGECEHIKGMIQEATVAFSHTKKNTEFLSLRYLVFFSLTTTFDIQTTWFLLPNFYKTWVLSLPPRSSSLKVTWDATSLAWSLKNSHPIKPTPVFLPGESQGWGRTESDTTEVT